MEPTYFEPLPSEIAPPAVKQQMAVAVDSPIQVLLVEDDPEAAELARIHITSDGNNAFRVEWTTNLLEAMGRLAKPGIDVVLLDLGMPELNGYKSYRAIESVAGKAFPVVIFTSDDSLLSRDLTIGFGAADYLVKHRTSPAELRLALLKAVQRGRR